MQILLADDHTVLLDGLELLLSTFDFVKKVDKAVNEEELYHQLSNNPLPDIILLDIVFGKTDGKELCKKLKQQYPQIKIIALTSYSDIATVKASLQAGFDGYLLKSEDRNTIMQALQTVVNNQQFYSPQVKNSFFNQSVAKNNATLTKREEEILKLILDEKTTKEISEELFISEKTVENHRASLMLKLDAKNMAGLVKKAITKGYI
ncbi:MAG: response regulator transcription factor [Chitinophagales bacterium]|jgi:DNA-binding NarL/FixJ family response regulator|nr:response regulator transcription factor [Chitinophagales bacterium]